MPEKKKFIVSHAPFLHNGSSISERSLHTMLAAAPALLMGISQYGMPAVGVLALSVSSAMLWELAMNRVTHRPVTIGDWNAAWIGLLFAMMLPATAPWWLVVTGTFVAVIIGKQIYGGIGANAFHPVAVSVAILGISWKSFLNFNAALVHYDLGFPMDYHLTALKHAGTAAVQSVSTWDLLMAHQSGAIGATFGLGLIAGGIYLILRGFIRWEITLSFVVGLIVTAVLFHAGAPEKFAGPMFHLFSGYTLIGAVFLATEDSSSPVNFLPMILYGALGGVLTILIRNIGAYADGVVYAILIINLANPLLDKIRPQSLGKAVSHA